MTKLTRKDLQRYKEYARLTDREIVKGYGCHYQSKSENLLELGYNSGIYGWNWTLYLDDGHLYIDGYRNY